MNQQNSVRTIAVVLGDNDFSNSITPLLETLHRGIVWNDGLSRETCEAAIRAGIEFHCLAFQFGRRFSEDGPSSIESVVRYLNAAKVLFDAEAESDISQKDHDGGAWYLEVATGKVYAY